MQNTKTKEECHSCNFIRNCTEYKEVFLCKKCKAEAEKDSAEIISTSSSSTNMNLINQIKKIEEEFDKLLIKVDYESDFEKGMSYEDRKDIYEPLKQFLKTSHLALLNSIIEDEEGKRKDIKEKIQPLRLEDVVAEAFLQGKVRAKDDTISSLKGVVEIISKQ